MKRLLAAGSGAIYQIARVFRRAEMGARHNPEFTLLEWYRPGFDHNRLMDEVAALAALALGRRRRETLSYGEAFAGAGLPDPYRAPVAVLRAAARGHGLAGSWLEDAARDSVLDALMGGVIIPELGHGELTFITDFPASQAALARVRAGEPPLAERFELIIDGLEIANGFHELTDAREQRARFARDNERRARAGEATVAPDERLLAALSAGLPPCAGVALGVDRLCMTMLGAARLDEVMAFPFERA